MRYTETHRPRKWVMQGDGTAAIYLVAHGIAFRAKPKGAGCNIYRFRASLRTVMTLIRECPRHFSYIDTDTPSFCKILRRGWWKLRAGFRENQMSAALLIALGFGAAQITAQGRWLCAARVGYVLCIFWWMQAFSRELMRK